MEILDSKALNTVHIGIIILDVNLEIVSWNLWMEKHSGHKKNEVIGRLVYEIIPIFKKNIYQDMFQETINVNHSWFCSSGIHKAYVYPKEPSDTDKYLRQNLQIDSLTFENKCYVLIQVFDQTTQHKRISTLKNAIKTLENNQKSQNELDSLDTNSQDLVTGFITKNVFEQKLSSIFKNHLNSEEKLYIIFIKISSYNDIYSGFGIEYANNIIKEISRRLNKNVDNNTIISHSDGNFLLLISHYDTFDEFIKYINVLIKSIDFKYYIKKESISTAPKIGISVYPDDGNNVNTIIKNAESAQINLQNDSQTNYSFYNNMLEALNKVHLNLHESQMRYQLLFDNMEEGFLCAEAIFNDKNKPIDAKIIEVNNYFTEIFKISKIDILGENIIQFIKKLTNEDFDIPKLLENILIDNNPIKISEKYFDTIDMWFSINLYRISETAFALMLSDITKSKKHEEVILRLAYYDNLTNLPNRKMFFDHANHIFEMSKRSSSSFAIAFIDFNNFKDINDLLGHDIGDQVLIKGADFLRNGVRKSDFVARIGGDEFIILFTNVNDKADIIHLIERLLNNFDIAYLQNNTELRVTISIGISIYPDDGDNLNEIISKADQSMYKAKALKKHTYLFYE